MLFKCRWPRLTAIRRPVTRAMCQTTSSPGQFTRISRHRARVSPNCGTTTASVIYGSAFTPFQPAGYHPSNPSGTLTTTGANFWFDTAQSTQGVDTGQTTIPNSQWSWAYCPNGPSGAGYTPNPILYLPKQRRRLQSGRPLRDFLHRAGSVGAGSGLGLDARFCLVPALRHDGAWRGHQSVAGTVTKGLIIGVSQSGYYIRSLIFYGFNQDEWGRIVFDGGWNLISSRMCG